LKEGTATQIEYDKIVPPLKMECFEIKAGPPGGAVGAAEGGKIMDAGKKGTDFRQETVIQLVGNMGQEGASQRRGRRTIQGAIAIPPQDGVLSWIEGKGNVLHSNQSNRFGQKGIASSQDAAQGNVGIGEKGYHLAEGMNAGVGSARSGDANRFSEKTSQGGFHGLLDGRSARLALPAVEVRPLIFKNSLNPSHRFP